MTSRTNDRVAERDPAYSSGGSYSYLEVYKDREAGPPEFPVGEGVILPDVCAANKGVFCLLLRLAKRNLQFVIPEDELHPGCLHVRPARALSRYQRK